MPNGSFYNFQLEGEKKNWNVILQTRYINPECSKLTTYNKHSLARLSHESLEFWNLQKLVNATYSLVTNGVSNQNSNLPVAWTEQNLFCKCFPFRTPSLVTLFFFKRNTCLTTILLILLKSDPFSFYFFTWEPLGKVVQ